MLTAAHCIHLNAKFEIIVGEHDRTNSSDGTRHEVCGSSIHPRYLRRAYGAPTHDFAMVQLKTPVQISHRANPACLPKVSWGGDFLDGKNMTVSGWGTLASKGEQPTELHGVNVPGVPFAQCEEAYKGNLTIPESVLGSMMCAGDVAEGGIDSCQGDSGGKFLEK